MLSHIKSLIQHKWPGMQYFNNLLNTIKAPWITRPRSWWTNLWGNQLKPNTSAGKWHEPEGTQVALHQHLYWPSNDSAPQNITEWAPKILGLTFANDEAPLPVLCGNLLLEVFLQGSDRLRFSRLSLHKWAESSPAAGEKHFIMGLVVEIPSSFHLLSFPFAQKLEKVTYNPSFLLWGNVIDILSYTAMNICVLYFVVQYFKKWRTK